VGMVRAVITDIMRPAAVVSSITVPSILATDLRPAIDVRTN
jgi:hypothetical protein